MQEGHYLSLGENCFLDIDREILLKDNHPYSLSRIQFRLLHYLAKNLERIVTREELIDYAWGKNAYVSNAELHVYMSRIRSKLENKSKDPKCLLSIRGVIVVPRN